MEITIGREAGILGRIFRIGMIAQHPVSQVEDKIAVLINDVFEVQLSPRNCFLDKLRNVD